MLEQYRLDEIEKQGTRQDKRKILTQEEEQEARLYLSAPNLMERTKEDIGKAGVIGEENNRPSSGLSLPKKVISWFKC